MDIQCICGIETSWESNKKKLSMPGTVAHTCNPSTLEVQAAGSPGQQIETTLANMVKLQLY